VLGHHQPEHGVAQELEALVGRPIPLLGAPRAVGQRLFEQGRIGEAVPDQVGRLRPPRA